MFDPADGPGLLARILEEPDADQPRLCYSDWLIDRAGKYDAERANFIRCQVNRLIPTTHMQPSKNPPDDCPERMERYAVKVYVDEHRNFDRVECLLDIRVPNGLVRNGGFVLSRGFISEISLPCADFLRHAAALFAEHPIERVTLTDKEPELCGSGQARWFGQDLPHHPYIPKEIYDLLPKGTGSFSFGGFAPNRFFDSPVAATNAISQALVACGKNTRRKEAYV